MRKLFLVIFILSFLSPACVYSESRMLINNARINNASIANPVANGTACSSGSECLSGNCIDGYCCNTTCTGSACQTCGTYSSAGAGTCGYVNSSSVDPDNECGTTGCYTGNCSGSAYSCGYYTSGERNCTTACTTCTGATSGSCANVTNNTQDTEGSYTCSATCKKCSAGSCVNQTSSEDLFNQCSVTSCPAVMNERTEMNCNTVCAGQTTQNGLCNGSGACSSSSCTCAGIGTDTGGTNGKFMKYYLGACTADNNDCTKVMNYETDTTLCSGYWTKWTYCRCQ